MELVTLGEVLDRIPHDAHLIPTGACGTPTTLLGGLGDVAARRRGLALSAGLLFGDADFEEALRAGHLRYRSWQISGRGRAQWRSGLVEYLPMRSTDVPAFLASSAHVALIRVGPPDDDGWCSFGPSTAFARELVSRSELVLAEVSNDVPRTGGVDHRIHVSEISAATRSQASPPSYTAGPIDDRAAEVARRVRELIPVGATLQLGIGSITEALVPLLEPIAREMDLALVGMLTESMIRLAENIVTNGRGPVRSVDALGGPTLMRFMDGNPDVEMTSVSDLLSPAVLEAIPRFVSINSAMAIDLKGQVVAETAAGRVISGLGGSADFFDGAARSAGGLRVIALPSMRGDRPSIVHRHDPEDLVSIPHHGVDVVVTEHGAAWLQGKSQRQRALALLAIADPASRGRDSRTGRRSTSHRTDIMTGPLAGKKLVEFGGLGPTPFAAMLMADLGADVIRIDRPQSLFSGSPQTYHRGRPAIHANLKDPADVAFVLRLVERADATVEGFRPGVMERLGLGPEVCLASNPKLVYGRMTGWGQTGPWSQVAGHDINYLAATGVLHHLRRKGEAPLPPLNLLGDFAGGSLYLVLGLLSAMIEAERSGIGQVVDAAIVDGVASMMASMTGRLRDGTWSRTPGESLLDTGAPFYNVYETSDGCHMAVGAIEGPFYRNLVRGLGLSSDELPEQMDRAAWPRLKAVFAQRFITQTAAHWTAVFDGAEACVTKIVTVDEAATGEHLAARRTFLSVEGGFEPQAAPRLSRTPARARTAEEATRDFDPDAWGLVGEDLERLL
ncbi:CoA transferase [Yinghuangia aomiensis]